MTWQFLILISVFLYSISVLLQKTLLKPKQSDPIAFSILFQILTGIIIGLFGFLISSMTFPNLKPLLPNLILMTLFYGFGSIFLFKALKKIEASKFTIIFSSRALFTILASSIILNEVLTLKQYLGTLLIILGVIIANIKAAKLTFTKNEATALLAAVCFGLAITNDKFLLETFTVYPYVTTAFIIPGLFVALLNPGKTSKITQLLQFKTLPKILLLCIIYASSAIAFYFALQISNNSSQIASINLTSIIVIVLLAIIFLKERNNLAPKILGAISSFIGLLLVS